MTGHAWHGRRVPKSSRKRLSSAGVQATLGDTGYRANPAAFFTQMDVFRRMSDIGSAPAERTSNLNFVKLDHGAIETGRDGSQQENRNAPTLCPSR